MIKFAQNWINNNFYENEVLLIDGIKNDEKMFGN